MDEVEDIKSRLSIEDVISEYVQLKRAGRNLKGLSPFSNEKTPSFMVSPEKQIWHDFSSGKGGNMFSFVMEVEGLDFRGALELLARKANIDLSNYRTGSQAKSGKQKERILQANELAAKFFQAHLKQHKAALEYVFKVRKINKETALSFRLGYAPNTGTALADFMKKRGFTDEELSRAGLVSVRFRTSDMFRGRIMIPLMDAQGQVIGFTGRQLIDQPNSPKYLNTPQTLLYDKSRHVFGLHLAKDSIRKLKFAVIVEGNMDVITSHQAGVTAVVATAGTAMTEAHLKGVGRFSPDIRLAFDQDDAGVAATVRAIPLAQKAGVSLSIIDIQGGKDPDELIQKNPGAWKQAITNNNDVLDWLITQYQKRADLETYAGREQFKQAVLSSVKRLQSAGEQGVYMQKVAQILGYSNDAITDELKLLKIGKTTYRKPAIKPVPIDKTQLEGKRIQDRLMALCLLQPPLRFHLKTITTEMLFDDEARALLLFLQEHPDFSGTSEEMSALKDFIDYVKVISLQYEELYHDLGLLELRNEATRMQIRLVEQYVKTKKQILAEAMRVADDDETTQLLTQAKELDELLKQHKGAR
jgi:DNA primase